jgi:hypothetical protein
VAAEFPEYPVATTYDELSRAIDELSRAGAP